MLESVLPQVEPAPSNPQPTAPQSTSQGSCVNVFFFLAFLSWIVVLSAIREFTNLGASINPDPGGKITALIGVGVQLILAGIPLAITATFWIQSRYKAIFQAWFLATVYMVFLLPGYLPGLTDIQAQTFLQILGSLVFCVLLVFLIRHREKKADHLQTDLQPPQRSRTKVWLMCFLVAALSSLPWFAWGTFGSVLDTVLGLLFGLVLGLASVLLFYFFIYIPLRSHGSNLWSDYLLAGLGGGAMLFTMASATTFCYGGMQWLLMLILPGLAWILAAILLLDPAMPGPGKTPVSQRAGINTILPLSLLVGLVAAAPLTLIDPDDLPLVASMGSGEILGKAFQAAFISAIIILSIAVVLLIVYRFQRGRPSTEALVTKGPSRGNAILGIATLAAVALAIGVYFFAGQPGWHGERMFVILKDQADVSSAASIKDYNARRQAVYKTLVEHANTTQSDLRLSLDRLGIAYTPYYLVNALEMPDNPFLRFWLSRRPEVDRILNAPLLRPLPSRPPGGEGNITQPPTGTDWNLTLIGADKVWKDFGVTGQGILIGQSDSGVQGDHPELAAAYRGKGGHNDYNWFDPWNHTSAPVDLDGHGTHTTGIILGKDTGVAPGANWMACVNLARNLANPGFYLDCWQFNFAPFPLGGDPLKDGKPELGAQILNNSWGCPEVEGCDANAFLAAVRALRSAGVFIVASAGNDGPKCGSLETPPPTYAEAFAVGSVRSDGQLSDFSSIGPVTADGSQRVKPDILAPGEDVLSSFPGNSYEYESGTSMAGPHVVGVVALMWAANPLLIGDIDRTEQILKQTATPYHGYLPNCPGAKDTPSTATGYGIVNAYAAVKMALGK